jgi:hypothetical protein
MVLTNESDDGIDDQAPIALTFPWVLQRPPTTKYKHSRPAWHAPFLNAADGEKMVGPFSLPIANPLPDLSLLALHTHNASRM